MGSTLFRRSSRSLSAALLAALTASAALAGYMGIVDPIDPLDVLVERGTLSGQIRFEGGDHSCFLEVTRHDFTLVREYDLRLRVGGSADGADGPVYLFKGSLRSQRDHGFDAQGRLVIDVRGYPSKSKTIWKLSFDEAGALRSLWVQREGGFMGIGERTGEAEFQADPEASFRHLHRLRR